MNEDWLEFKKKFLAEKKANDEALLAELKKTVAELSEQNRIALTEIAQVFQQAFKQGKRR